MYKKIIAALLTLVMVLSSTAFVMAANVTMSITIGTGEQKSLDTYLQAGATNVSWSNSAPSVVKISGNKITGSKVGNAVISGSANGVSYEFKIKVLKNFSGYQDIINQSSVILFDDTWFAFFSLDQRADIDTYRVSIFKTFRQRKINGWKCKGGIRCKTDILESCFFQIPIS